MIFKQKAGVFFYILGKLNIEIQTITKQFNEIENHLELIVGSAVKKEAFKLRSEFTAELFKGNIRREEVEQMIEVIIVKIIV